MPLFGVRSCPLFRAVKETNTRQKKERIIATGYKQLCFIGCGPPRQHSHSVIDNYTHIPLNAHHKLDFLCKCHLFFASISRSHTHTHTGLFRCWTGDQPTNRERNAVVALFTGSGSLARSHGRLGVVRLTMSSICLICKFTASCNRLPHGELTLAQSVLRS